MRVQLKGIFHMSQRANKIVFLGIKLFTTYCHRKVNTTRQKQVVQSSQLFLFCFSQIREIAAPPRSTHDDEPGRKLVLSRGRFR